MNSDFFINIRQLYYFISVAETLSFTKAAQLNHIAQTAMSQNILTLEKQLDLTLFERTKRKVKLTASGQKLYIDIKRILDDLETAISQAQNIDKGFEGNLRIGFQGIHESRILPAILHSFQKQYPKINIILMQDSLRNLGKNLEEKKLDIIFTLSREEYNDEIINEYIFSVEPLCAVVSSDHPLAHKEYVRRDMFAEEPIIFIKPQNSSGTYNQMVSDCKKAGFDPNVVAYTDTVEAAIILVSAGMGISFFPRCCQGQNPDVIFLELANDNTVELSIRWRKDTLNSALILFLETMKEFVHYKKIGTEHNQ